MKLVTFEVPTPVGPARRVGAVLDAELTGDARIADLTSAYADLLREGGEPRAYEAAAALLPPDMLAFLEGGSPARERARQVVEFLGTHRGGVGTRGETLIFSRADVRVLAPVPRPRSIRDYSTYEEHMSTRRPQKPPVFYHAATCYKGNPEAVGGPEDSILYPAYTDWRIPSWSWRASSTGGAATSRSRTPPATSAATRCSSTPAPVTWGPRTGSDPPR
jgi:hypothetical protein